MASPDLHTSWLSSTVESFGGSFNIRIEEEGSADSVEFLEDQTSPVCNLPLNIPEPPPLPGKIYSRATNPRQLANSGCVPKETKDTWDRLFKEGFGADVHVITEDGSVIPAHYALLVSIPLIISYQLHIVCIFFVEECTRSLFCYLHFDWILFCTKLGFYRITVLFCICKVGPESGYTC